ncbi:MAG TPA: hypothetical protein VIH99_02105 [Bdellovibrionota bacterium]|jgi:hypothetical protein
MELRQNWHKFQRILGPLPPKKSGLVLLLSHNRVVAGAVGFAAGALSRSGFRDLGRQVDDMTGAWDDLSAKYQCAGASFIDQRELLNALSQVAAVRASAPATDHFHAQVARLRELLGVERGEKSRLATHLGERPVEHFWPRKNFLLGLYRSFFGELFPERKLLLVGVVNSPDSFDSLLLEFQGAEVKGFSEPDFSGIDWKGLDLFLPETAARFVAWCENHYVLPAYSIFLSRRVWDEVRTAQMSHGEKAAWRLLQKIRSQRDVEKEVLFEPEPWPMKALLRWHGMRG